MIFNITLKDNKTGETKVIEYNSTHKSSDVTEEELVDFIWKEGNYSCDCNRHIFFYDSDTEENPCGDERFTLLKIEPRQNDLP